jgi:cytochrome P450
MTPCPLEYDPTDAATHADPYPIYERLRRDAPLSYCAALDCWALARHDDVATALNDRETFASSTAGLSARDRYIGLREADYVAGDSERHDALRRVARRVLGPDAVEALEPAIARIAHTLLDDLVGTGVVDLAAGYARRLPVLVTCAALGLPVRDEPYIAAGVDAVFGRAPGSAGVPPSAARAHAELCAYLLEAARDGASAGLAELDDARQAGLISDTEVVDIAFILLAAGIKTTSTLISGMVHALARDPHQARLAWSDHGRAPAVVEEALRFDAPAQWVARIATRDAVTPHGVIPAGARVLLLLGSANRDERRYAAPDRFDITREPRRHLAFGAGMHFCSGARLARTEARIALEALRARSSPPEPAGTPKRIFTPAERELAELPVSLDMAR